MYGDHYAKNMYIEDSPQYQYHWRTYGHQSKVGFKDVIKQWKAEKFDPDYLMELYVNAGAQYFVAQAVHHDNFDNWNSKYQNWNSVNIGPCKDIVGMWHEAANKFNLPFGVSEHLAGAFTFLAHTKGSDTKGPYAGVPYDTNNPKFADLYISNKEYYEKARSNYEWYTDNCWWHERWFERMKDLIDQHQPDLLYSDEGVPLFNRGLDMIAHLYNTSASTHNGVNNAVYNQKDRNPDIHTIGVLDIERSALKDISKYPWQTCTCIGGWFYDVKQIYKTAKHVIESLVNIVSKNGNMLLSVPQRPDGMLDDECMKVINDLTKWFKVNSNGIFDTRPWKIYGEGPSCDSGTTDTENVFVWTSEDFRFTYKSNNIYAFQMEWPQNNKALIKSFSLLSNMVVNNVHLLGVDNSLCFTQTEQGLLIELPENKVCEYVHCFKIEFIGRIEDCIILLQE